VLALDYKTPFLPTPLPLPDTPLPYRPDEKGPLRRKNHGTPSTFRNKISYSPMSPPSCSDIPLGQPSRRPERQRVAPPYPFATPLSNVQDPYILHTIPFEGPPPHQRWDPVPQNQTSSLDNLDLSPSHPAVFVDTAPQGAPVYLSWKFDGVVSPPPPLRKRIHFLLPIRPEFFFALPQEDFWSQSACGPLSGFWRWKTNPPSDSV